MVLVRGCQMHATEVSHVDSICTCTCGQRNPAGSPSRAAPSRKSRMGPGWARMQEPQQHGGQGYLNIAPPVALLLAQTTCPEAQAPVRRSRGSIRGPAQPLPTDSAPQHHLGQQLASRDAGPPSPSASSQTAWVVQHWEALRATE
jgi:hypothetical protein